MTKVDPTSNRPANVREKVQLDDQPITNANIIERMKLGEKDPSFSDKLITHSWRPTDLHSNMVLDRLNVS